MADSGDLLARIRAEIEKDETLEGRVGKVLAELQTLNEQMKKIEQNAGKKGNGNGNGGAKTLMDSLLRIAVAVAIAIALGAHAVIWSLDRTQGVQVEQIERLRSDVSRIAAELVNVKGDLRDEIRENREEFIKANRDRIDRIEERLRNVELRGR